LKEVASVINRAFGRNLESDDIYVHVTQPEVVYLLRQQEKIVAMASYNVRKFADIESLVVEGIAVAPEMQGKGVFKTITDYALNGERVVCLRTQNPRMYRALEKYCAETYPGEKDRPVITKAITLDFAKYLKCNIDGNGVVKGYYGGLFYGQEPHHSKVDSLFQKLGVNLHEGDGLLVVGETLQPKCF